MVNLPIRIYSLLIVICLAILGLTYVNTISITQLRAVLIILLFTLSLPLFH